MPSSPSLSMMKIPAMLKIPTPPQTPSRQLRCAPHMLALRGVFAAVRFGCARQNAPAVASDAHAIGNSSIQRVLRCLSQMHALSTHSYVPRALYVGLCMFAVCRCRYSTAAGAQYRQPSHDMCAHSLIEKCSHAPTAHLGGALAMHHASTQPRQ